MKNPTKFICFNAAVAALYVVFTMPFGVITTTSGFQFRPAEALTILPALCPYTVVGLTIGCAVSNLVSQFGIFDIVLGSAVTLLAGLLTSTKLFNKFWSAPIPPVVLNAALLPLIWFLVPESEVSFAIYAVNAGSLLLTQSVVIFGLGIPLYFLTKKSLLKYMELK